jgi:ABC-type lipoprotein export system ATPase subunit
MSDAIIKTEELKETCRGRVRTEALRGVTFEIERSRYVCIAGPSGHSKSTLLHLIDGLDRPTSGRVLISGTDITCLLGSQIAEIRVKRIAIARALSNDPDILLMDEPTRNLDSSPEAEVLKYIDAVHERGKIIIIVTHSEKIARRRENRLFGRWQNQRNGLD